jgi:hypothetical protein
VACSMGDDALNPRMQAPERPRGVQNGPPIPRGILAAVKQRWQDFLTELKVWYWITAEGHEALPRESDLIACTTIPYTVNHFQGTSR